MLAILWRQDGSEGFAWYVRGIREDGLFYGEVRYQSSQEERCMSVHVSGRLKPEERVHLGGLVEVIRRTPTQDLADGHFAALIERLDPSDFGKIGLFFRYRVGDEHACPAARAFLGLVGIVERHLSPSYARLAEHGAANGGA